MSFAIETYDRNYLEGMAALYNAETAFEAHIAPLTPERFVELVEGKSCFDPSGLFIAVALGQVVGWVHACVAAGSEARHDPEARVPRIRMLIYPRDRLKVGGALVAEATNWLVKTRQRKFLALHAQAGYPLYRGLWMGGEPMCPATLPHVHLALEAGGYRNTQESIFMAAEIQAPPQGVHAAVKMEPVDSAAEMAHEPMRESWAGFGPMCTRAMMGEDEVGSIAWVLLPHVADRLGAPCVNIWGMGVGEPHRRIGIATALISHVVARGHALGARFASVGTQLWNTPAHAAYAKLGFRPHCVVVGRTLEMDADRGLDKVR